MSTSGALLAKGARVAGPGITKPPIAASMGNHLGVIDVLRSHWNGNKVLHEAI